MSLSPDAERVLAWMALYRDDLEVRDLLEEAYGRLSYVQWLLLNRWADEYDTVADLTQAMEQRRQAQQ